MFDGVIPRLSILILCAVGAYGLRHQSFHMPPHYWYALIAAVVLYMIGWQVMQGRYSPRPINRLMGEMARLLLIALVLTLVAYAFKISDLYSRLWSVYWLESSWLLLALWDAFTTPRTGRRLILVGETKAVQNLQHSLGRDDGSREILCLRLDQALAWLAQEGADQARPGDEILLVGQVPAPADRTALILALHGKQVALRYCPEHGEVTGGVERDTLPVLPMPGAWEDALKRFEDMLLGGLALGLCAPVLVVIALAVRLGGRGPIFFRQRRLGLGGRAFTIYKFRTMEPQAADHAEAPQVVENDARVTRIGVFLRRWGLDELPQLINVLSGEMSLVGPRPHAFPHDVYWGAQLPHYAQRFRMRPGITGLAQINGQRGYADTIDDIEARLALDLRYVGRWSLLLDLRILAGTIPALLRSDESVAGFQR